MRNAWSLGLLVVLFTACGGDVSDPGVARGAALSSSSSFQNGASPSASYAGATDTMLQQSAPTANLGTSASLTVDHDSPTGSRQSTNALLRFDLSSIPAGSTVQAVTLTLNVTNRTTAPINLYVLNRAWTANAATWLRATASSTWAGDGARGSSDRASAAVASFTPSVTGKVIVSLDAAGVSAVQGWVKSPGSNDGLVLDSPSNADGLQFDASEASVAGNRPRLTVSFTAPPASPPTSGFVHPGVGVSSGQLAYTKAQLAAGAAPWTTELAKAEKSTWVTSTWTDQTVASMKCGNGGSSTDVGCTAARNDALRAYTLALLWYYTGNKSYASRAIQILNAWSSKLVEIQYDANDNDTWNGPLDAAWFAEMMPRSAELLRHTDSGWSSADAARFGTMLEKVIVPRIENGWYGKISNWNLSMANGLINVGVYNDDAVTFNKGVALYDEVLPHTFYLTSDGPFPRGDAVYTNADGTWKSGKLAAAWWGAHEFGQARDNGINSEFCRDLEHTQAQVASASLAAETARIQGTDLYGRHRARLLATFEYVSRYINLYAPPNDAIKAVAVPTWLCTAGVIQARQMPAWEVGYNHFKNGEHLSLPETMTNAVNARKYASTTNTMMAWETLTHAGTGDR